MAEEVKKENGGQNAQEKNHQDETKKVETKGNLDEKNVEILKEQLIKAEKDKAEWMNKYYAQYADIQNLRKEIARDNETVLKYAGEPFLKSLVPFMVSLDQAFKYEPKDDPKAQGWIKGIHLSYKQLLSALEKEGVKIIDPKPGDKFDPKSMEAVATYEDEKGDVIRNVYMKGYFLKERLITPASVEVSIVRKKPMDDKSKDVKDVKVESNNK